MAKYLIKIFTDAANINIVRKKLETVGLVNAAQIDKVAKEPTKADRVNEAELRNYCTLKGRPSTRE